MIQLKFTVHVTYVASPSVVFILLAEEGLLILCVCICVHETYSAGTSQNPSAPVQSKLDW